jgi:hypothetical protein
LTAEPGIRANYPAATAVLRVDVPVDAAAVAFARLAEAVEPTTSAAADFVRIAAAAAAAAIFGIDF